jgi:glyoxylase-like metal-dependent hydrolase (beta-lactamase superfamily II)
MTAIPAGQDVTGVEQLAAWRARVMPPVEQLAGDLWSIPVPIPNNPLRYVSSYAFAPAGGGLVLLDTGWAADASWEALVAGLSSIGASLTDVRGVLVSHMHFDHMGLAGRVREASGAWIAMHPADTAIVAELSARDAALAVSREVAFLITLGASADEAAAAVGPVEGYRGFASMAVPDRSLGDGELADVPGWRLRAVHTPGHTPGHVCFVDELSRRLFAGDHILPRITPNISVHAVERVNPLFEYLKSLAKVRDLDVDEVLPAHEWRFRGLAERADDIAAHHERRLAELLAAIAAHPDATSWDLAGLLTWSRPWDQYSGRIRISAVTETAAHVLELVRRGLAAASGGPVPAYRVAAGVVG